MKNAAIHTMVMQDQLRIARGAASFVRDNTVSGKIETSARDCINALNKLEQNLTALIAHIENMEGK
jgi:hypothetical protein